MVTLSCPDLTSIRTWVSISLIGSTLLLIAVAIFLPWELSALLIVLAVYAIFLVLGLFARRRLSDGIRTQCGTR